MNLLTHFKQIILPLLIAIVFGCFGILPQAAGVARLLSQLHDSRRVQCDELSQRRCWK